MPNVKCPQCAELIRIHDDKAGECLTCPTCGAAILPILPQAKQTAAQADVAKAREEFLQMSRPASPPAKRPEPQPATKADVAELRDEVRRLREAAPPKPPRRVSSPAATAVIAACVAVFFICTGVLSTNKKNKGDTSPTGFYGMTVDECLARWGVPTRVINPQGPSSALVYDGAGVRVIMGGNGRTIRFDDNAGNKINSYSADEKLRGIR